MQCYICNEEFLNNSSQIIRHVQLFHRYELNYRCFNYTCKRIFSSISSLKKHFKKCVINENSSKLSILPSVSSLTDYYDLRYDDNNTVSASTSQINDNVETRITTVNLEDNILQFIGQLYSNSSIPRSVVQDVVENFESLSQIIISFFKANLKTSIPLEYHDNINSCMQMDILSDLNTEYKRFKFFHDNNLLIYPQSFLIGEISDDKKVDGTVVLTHKQCYAQVIPMRTVLKKFFELPNVYRTVINYIRDECSPNTSFTLYTSLFQGKLWKTISKNFNGKTVIPLYLYYDDFEISNPLSSAAGIYKIGALYFSIASIPPEFSSLVDSVFLAQFIHSVDLKNFGNENCFWKIIEELNHLAEVGIVINVDEHSYQLFFVVIGILGDNLGMNSLLGFPECFRAEHFCRFCKASRKECNFELVENKQILRNIDNYEVDVQTLSYGIKEKCAFNAISYYHCTTNNTCDLMHDVYLGVCRYDMATIINHCIRFKYFSLENLNNRLKYFDYSEADRGKKISSISADHIRKGCIIITASEMSALISYFGIIIGDLVPLDDVAWELYLTLYEIIDVITSSAISEHELIYLEQLIKNHNQLYLQFSGELVPKDHFLVHYPTCIKNMGPVRYLSSSKYESFHQLSKKYAKIINSRVNITYTLALNIQLQLCYKFLSQEGLKTNLEYGRVIEIPKNYKSKFSKHLGTESFIVSWVKINGTCYKPGFAIYVENDDDDYPLFGMIVDVIMDGSYIFLVYKKCFTIGFNNHMKGYEIILPNNYINEQLFKIDKNFYVRPIKVHISGSGDNIISRRDLH